MQGFLFGWSGFFFYLQQCSFYQFIENSQLELSLFEKVIYQPKLKRNRQNRSNKIKAKQAFDSVFIRYMVLLAKITVQKNFGVVVGR